MKKNNNRGFLLTELLVTATLVGTVLIFLYTQFYSVKRSYENSFKYNNINDLYAVDNIRSYLIDKGYISTYVSMAKKGEILTPVPYLELTSFINNDNYFNRLIYATNVKKLYFTKEFLADLIIYLNDNNVDLNNAAGVEKLRKFVNYIDYDFNNSIGYRLIAEFDDGTFATLLVGGE